MSVMQCPKCGKQYRLNEQVAGKQIRCLACQNIFRAPEIALDAALVADTVPEKPARRSDEIDYEVFGSEMQYAEVTLDPNEMVIAEAGGMMYMTSGIKMDTVFGDPSQQAQGFWSKVASAGKRVLTGESLFMTTFTNVGAGREVVAFASPYPGKIVPMHLDQLGGEIICQKDSFLCGARGVQVSIAFQKKIGVGLFGGEGFIMQRLKGDGIVLLHAGGTMMVRDIRAGERLRLDTGCLMALTPSVEYDVEFVGGFKNTLFGGEGLFLATLTGPGRVWCQSLPFSRFAGRILANAPGVGRGGKEEGSLLNNMGGLGSMLMGDNS
ncbi:MAG: TIGR00266 family protein [Pirellulaceae bacterium]